MIDAEFLQMQTTQTSDPSEENYFKVLRGKNRGRLLVLPVKLEPILLKQMPNSNKPYAPMVMPLVLLFKWLTTFLTILATKTKTGKKNRQ